MPHLRLIILFCQSFIFSMVTPTNLVPLLCPSEEGPNCSCNNAYKPLHLYSHLLSTPKLKWIWNPCRLTGEITTGNASTVSVPASNLRWICNQANGQDNSFISFRTVTGLLIIPFNTLLQPVLLPINKWPVLIKETSYFNMISLFSSSHLQTYPYPYPSLTLWQSF